MGLFSRGNKNNNSTQSEKKSVFSGKKIRIEVPENYSQYSESRLFAQFKNENWNIKSPGEKIAVLQEIENREAVAHNRPAAEVVQAYGSSYGGYSNEAHRIEIRLTGNQFEDLDTLFHESEHANQSSSPINSVSFSENDKKLMSIEDMTSSDGINSHYSKYGTSLYKVMTSELDANNVALEKVSSLKNEYRGEEKYQEYLVGRQEYYDSLADAIEIKSSEKKAALLNTIEYAYIRDELSESEYSELKELITNTESYDLCEMRTAEINETLSQIDMQDKSSIENLLLDRGSTDTMTGETMNAARQQLAVYMAEHNYDPADFAEYSQDQEWRILHREAYPDYEMPPLTQESAQRQKTQYMNEHNYGREDYAEYSQDPIWRELQAAAYPSHELPPLNESRNISDDTTEKTDSVEIEEEIETEEEVEVEDVEVKETEDMDSVMFDDVEKVEYEYSVMVEDLDNSEDVTEMENNSEMIDDLGETESVDSSMSESYDYSSSSDGMSSDRGDGMDRGGGMDMG